MEACGTVEAHIAMNGDLIGNISFHGDYFSTISPVELGKLFVGLPLNAGALQVALEGKRAEDYITGLENDALIALLCGE
jgi:hypothetical protein